MIRVDLPDEPTADRLVEALHVAAGTCPGTVRAARWRLLAEQVETALDALPPRRPDELRAAG